MSADNLHSNTRVAKNTLYLYFRTLFVMGVTIFTSRIILDALGIEDYGIYNVVGGFVSMFSVEWYANCGKSTIYSIRVRKGKSGNKESVFNHCLNTYFAGIYNSCYSRVCRHMVPQLQNEYCTGTFVCCKLGLSMFCHNFLHKYNQYTL